MFSFGPVPSRRLGRSLGVNNIPPKVCTYSCVYCQLGRTDQMSVDRRSFYDPENIFADVEGRVIAAAAAGEPIEYLTFVPDGEPTLDRHLSQAIHLLRPLGVPIAVITNSSLIWREDVREDLMAADWVSVKVDAIRDGVWCCVDRPHGTLNLSAILDGLCDFSASFPGTLVTETMLVENVNDSAHCARELRDVLVEMRPTVAYLGIPTRPPAEPWVRPPSTDVLNAFYQMVGAQLPRVEYLIGYEGNAFASTGDVEADLLSITSVHPMREDAVREFLADAGATWFMVEGLLCRGQLVQTEYQGNRYYLRDLFASGRSE